MKNEHHWRSYYDDIGLNPLFAELYNKFVSDCIASDIPPIFEFDHLSQLVGVGPEEISSMVFGTESFYREFKIRKRSGGTRKISAPYPSLLRVQRWIKEHILEKLELSICATGYTKFGGIVENAKRHCNRNILIKLDIVDFFPSIEIDRVVHLFVKIGYPRNVSFLLARLCTLKGSLPQGAATSPLISNLISKKMDDDFYRYCRKNRLRYTRYSDDICISGKVISNSHIRQAFEIIEAYGFELNRKKFRILGKGTRKVVTGIDITHGKLRVPRSFRRKLSQDIYFVWTAGLEMHLARERIFSPNYLEVLRGRLNFWKQIEPVNSQMQKCDERLTQLEKLGHVG